MRGLEVYGDVTCISFARVMYMQPTAIEKLIGFGHI